MARNGRLLRRVWCTVFKISSRSLCQKNTYSFSYWVRAGVLTCACVLLLALLSCLLVPLRPKVELTLPAGFPVRPPAHRRYPAVLADDVSGLIPADLRNSVAMRLAQHRQSSPLKLLSVATSKPSCLALVRGNSSEVSFAQQYMESVKPAESPLFRYLANPMDCENLLHSRGYIRYATEEERDFPIAYGIMMYRDPEQAERLLRAIYRPHNFYCIHVDSKSSEDIQSVLHQLVSCLPNVYLASRQNKVDWAQFNSLTPWIYCMEDLWRFSWKYFINLTGQEFPLKTNLQTVRILKALNGANVVDTTTHRHYARRWYYNFPPPHHIQPYKGLVFILASRGFVDYVIHSPVARHLLDWVKHTDFPDESFFSTLNHNTHLAVPGSYRGLNPETDAVEKPFIARFVNWGVGWKDSKGRFPYSWPCGGMRIRGVCIFGVRDLPLLTNRKELFANKFYLDFEPLTLDCLEEWHFNMTMAEYAGVLSLDISWYANLNIVKNKVL